MTDRERLLQILNVPIYPHENVDPLEAVADYLLDNGVRVPVLCKDCKHYDNSEGICWCHLNSKFYPGGMDWHSFPEDGFCSYGERIDDED